MVVLGFKVEDVGKNNCSGFCVVAVATNSAVYTRRLRKHFSEVSVQKFRSGRTDLCDFNAKKKKKILT